MITIFMAEVGWGRGGEISILNRYTNGTDVNILRNTAWLVGLVVTGKG